MVIKASRNILIRISEKLSAIVSANSFSSAKLITLLIMTLLEE